MTTKGLRLAKGLVTVAALEDLLLDHGECGDSRVLLNPLGVLGDLGEGLCGVLGMSGLSWLVWLMVFVSFSYGI